MLDLEKLEKDLDELQQLFCKNYYCSYPECPCSIDEFIGESCAIEAIQQGIKDLKRKLKEGE